MISGLLKRAVLRAKELQARLELRFRCPSCPAARRRSRDILGEGDCFWHANWSKGHYNIRSYRAYLLLRMLGINRPMDLDGGQSVGRQAPESAGANSDRQPPAATDPAKRRGAEP